MMPMTIRMRRIVRSLLTTTALALLASGCSIGEQAPPDLTGPSGFALSVTMTATPDRLPRDGSSQSVITMTVSDAQSRPVSGMRLTLASDARLSATEVVTDASGQATVAVTAPAASDLAGNTVTIQAIPVGSSGGAVPLFWLAATKGGTPSPS